MPNQFSASAPGKVNLHLGVGEARADGYHDLVTVFQAVDQREVVRLVVDDAAASEGESVVSGITTHWMLEGELSEQIDTPSNLAWRAVDAAVEAHRAAFTPVALPKVRIEVDKAIFVAGGMAGGSADAAASLVAASAYLEHYSGTALDQDKLTELAKNLGADVPFALMGGNALGTGRGDDLVEMLGRGEFWWVFVNPRVAINTGEAFGVLDDLRHDNPALVPHLDTTTVAQALTSSDPEVLAGALHNDLQAAALEMRPQLTELIRAGEAEALAAIVSGSGPTVAVLCRDSDHAHEVRDALAGRFSGYELIAAHGPAAGATLL
ncbi:4-diphosphocytidyl-2-C-methyl-D-erythritol kinase [Corynebacterium glaucum]|uniref:4-(cytidine 5'-diphospho)-2-C-methyl-D-erythritol kinase n=1 Tax=Corynebacterium glaucum TaxID=187491 RepID=UPI0025B3377A|nr:4-(cytidine 5'-diphospho)-2-C-methyl-D-erythritol kinase [Corynebacterium glaucum]WJZ07272.1 4-diphosphocytidyl-2-C-methyl-D-erythritol kinase [Corynebacterium glaucum]